MRCSAVLDSGISNGSHCWAAPSRLTLSLYIDSLSNCMSMLARVCTLTNNSGKRTSRKLQQQRQPLLQSPMWHTRTTGHRSCKPQQSLHGWPGCRRSAQLPGSMWHQACCCSWRCRCGAAAARAEVSGLYLAESTSFISLSSLRGAASRIVSVSCASQPTALMAKHLCPQKPVPPQIPEC